MSEIESYKRIEELESENQILRVENKRLRDILGLPYFVKETD
jgi:regulator of replication initiation timing